MSIKTYAMAVRDTIAAEMRRDPKVFVMGEDVEAIGSIFGCTRDLTKEFGTERAFNTPISEAGFVGAGLGAACTGMRPIVELMYMDFSFVAMDQLLNQVAKTRYIFGGRAKIPLVIRGQEGIGRGNAATHSQSVETIFMHFPGLKVACPSTGRDAAGLLRTAIRDDNPVMFFEHKALYSSKCDVPDDPEFMLPFGKADIKRAGTDVTIVANLLYVSRALEAAEELQKQGVFRRGDRPDDARSVRQGNGNQFREKDRPSGRRSRSAPHGGLGRRGRRNGHGGSLPLSRRGARAPGHEGVPAPVQC